MALDQAAVTRILTEAGCIAAAEEAGELVRATSGDEGRLRELVSRRTAGEPLAWLMGSVTFCGLALIIEPGVYVPRPQTEALARRAATLLPVGGIAIDLCTGCGPIAATLASSVPGARVVATDLDPRAVLNARRNGVEALEGWLDDPVPGELQGRVDVVTAVPPYVPTQALRLLPRDVQAFEPVLALDGGPEGIDLLAEVVRRSPRWLRANGRVLVELGGDQAESVGTLLRREGFDEIEVLRDEEGDARGLCGRLLGEPPPDRLSNVGSLR